MVGRMISLLHHPVFSRLFAAQVVALVGTGLLTVALALLAYDLAGDRAGAVLGTALTIKMVAYVGISPLATALFARLPRRAVLIGADLIRAAVALSLPFIDAVWQIYVLIFLLQAASATFTPSFQAVIADVLTDEEDYTHALSLSRMAYEIETLVSPALAAMLLTVMSYNLLFLGTVVGFVTSAVLILSVNLPARGEAEDRPFRERLTRGVRIYMATPRLRGLLALNMSVAAVVAFVLVNTVVLVRARFHGGEGDVALVMAAYGAGAMAVALILPGLLHDMRDRAVMVASSFGLALVGLAYGIALWIGTESWTLLIAVWFILGGLNAGILTPSGRLLKRSAASRDRPAVFTAQFALSHACWLIGYPAAGWLGASFGLPAALIVGAVVAGGMAVVSSRIWQG